MSARKSDIQHRSPRDGVFVAPDHVLYGVVVVGESARSSGAA